MSLSKPGSSIISVVAMILLVLATACGNPTPSFSDMDMQQWKDDKKGCNGKRATMMAAITEQRHKLQGLSEIQIVSLLGRPDSQELWKRHQKFYTYQIEAGKDCVGANGNGKQLTIRFNATGAAKEISVE